MKKAIMSKCKNSKDRSNKSCVCGGHNNNNHKSNKNHNSTKIKTLRRILRNFLNNG